MIDASLNRAHEGLRVVEDFVRFVIDDPHLTRHTKRIRHELQEVAASILPEDREAARETLQDVGTVVTTHAEQRRDDMASVCAANCARVAQSLRSLEEYCKLMDAALAQRFEALRYQTYTLQKCVGIAHTSGEKLAGTQLYVLLDGRETESRFAAIVRQLVAAGVHAIQLRDKRLDDRTCAARARQLTQLCRESDTLSIVNDRADIAVLAGADGVHVGQEELTVKDVRSVVGTRMLVGVSTHSLQQAQQAVLDGACYLGVGPVFASNTKQFASLAGTAFVGEVAAEIGLPWFAIGGINVQNVGQVMAAGARRVAIGSAIVDAPDPGQAAQELLAELQKAGN